MAPSQSSLVLASSEYILHICYDSHVRQARLVHASLLSFCTPYRMSMQSASRKSAPKVKTGCKTCKYVELQMLFASSSEPSSTADLQYRLRRVKCDENKPHCRRCTSTGRQCDGYTKPKEDFQFQVWSYSPVDTVQRSISALANLGDSMRYLEYYQRCARPILSDAFDNDFWSRTTLQMAQAEPAVRHALIALAYLHKTEDGSLKHARSNFAAHHESKTLLYHYNKSVRFLIERMAESSGLHEVGLVTCLLFVCIEYLRGNYHTAFTHMRNGFKIISSGSLTQASSSSPQDSESISSSPESLTSTTTLGSSVDHDHLTNYTSTGSSTLSIKCPSTLIENELRPLFIRAIASALMYGVEVDEVINIQSSSLQHFQGLQFHNIREVQSSFHELRNDSIVLIRNMSRILFWDLDQDRPAGPTISQKVLAQRVTILECQHAWYTAMEKFESQGNLPETDSLALSALKTQYHAVHIWTECATSARQTPFDAHMRGFQAILQEGRKILDSMDLTPPQSAARFTFEISLIPPIYFVATRCRCPVTRREAIDLLARNPPREGLWDAEQHVAVTKRVVEIEEEEVDPKTGWPVERTRLWSSVIDANMDRNGGFWAYFAPATEVYARTPGTKPKVLHEFFTL